MADIGDTVAPTSDQLDAVDLLAGPRTFTIARVDVRAGDEQPVNVHLAEFPRPWRPGKSMRRVLLAVWGADSTTYVGRRLTLYCDSSVRFGGAEVGGTRISHMSHLDRARTIPLLVTRGKSAPYVVRPLVETAPSQPTPPGVTDEQIATATTEDDLRALWSAATAEQRETIRARVEALRADPVDDDPTLTQEWAAAHRDGAE